MILEGPVPAVEEPGGWEEGEGASGGRGRGMGARVPSAAPF